MKKLLAVIAVVCAITGSLRAQNNNNPGGPANIAGNLYASNFAAWSVPQGNNGPLSWSYSSACSSATSGGTTFKPLIVGAPIRIVDSNPALSENVTVTSVLVAGSGCLINVTPSNPHQNFYLTTSTGGLQEAINFANGQPYVVILTPDWQRAGGNNGMIAAAKGNSNVSLLDQRTAISTPYLWNGSTYVATPYGGGALLPNPGIVFGLTSSTGRTAVLGDFVGNSAPAIWNGTPCTVGTNALLVNGQCGPSGGSGNVQSAPQQQIAGYNQAGTVAVVGPGSTTLNYVTPILQGVKDAAQFQTTPTSNNGLQNILSTPNSYANAGPAYTAAGGSEGATGVPFWRVPLIFFNTEFFWQTPVPFAVNTFYNDQRLGTTSSSLGYYSYNPVGQAQGGITIPLIYDRITHDQESVQPGHGQGWVGHQHDQSWTGSGINTAGIWDGRTGEQWNYISTRRGISNPIIIQTQCSGDGDCHPVQNLVFCAGGNSTGADEGCTNYRNENIENQAVFTATSPSNQATGTTQILGNYITSSGLPGDGFPLIDSTQSSAKCLITATNNSPVFTVAGSIVSTCTYTPDNIGHLVTDLSVFGIVLPKYNGVTTTVANVVVNGLSSPLVVGESCWADYQRIESAQITAVSALSGGSQTVTVNLRYPHQVQAYVVQGPNNCKYVEAMANRKGNTNAPLRDWARVIGASDAHTLFYAAIGAGGYQPWPQGSFNTQAFSPMTITRDGSGHASTVTTSDFSWAFSQSIITINTAVDPSYNRTVRVAQTGFGTVTFTWPDPGPAGTTTTTGPSPVLTNPNNFPPFGVESNAYIMFPGAEVVNTGNLATHVMDGSNLVEYNNMTVASGDTLEVQHGNEIITNLEHNLLTTWLPSSASISTVAKEEVFFGIPRPGFVWDRVQIGLDGGEAKLFSAGGTLTPTSEYLRIFGDRIWNTFIHTPAPSAGTGPGNLWLIDTCPLAGCTAQQDPYALIHIASGHSDSQFFYSEYNTTFGFKVNNQNFMTMGNNGFNYHGSDGTGKDYSLTVNVDNTDFELGSSGAHVSVVAAINNVSTTLNDGTGNNSIFTQTPTTFNMNRPLTIPSLISGAISTTGPVTVGGTGHSIGTGTASNTDLAGKVTLAGGTATQALAGTYTTAPIVSCTDTTTAAAVKCIASTTAITFTGTGTDVINYILIGLN